MLRRGMYDEGRKSKCGPAPLLFRDRFERNVDRSGGPDACHLWIGNPKKVYPQIRVGSRADGTSRNELASHAAWELTRGPIPEGHFVLHNCPTGDNPRCVNIKHLWTGTHQQNMADKVAKGRQYRGGANSPARGLKNGRHTKPERTARGSKNGEARFNEDQVRLIRELLEQKKMTQAEIALLCGVTTVTISLIWRRRVWKHVA